jgi:ComEC/Rec2-related protein
MTKVGANPSTSSTITPPPPRRPLLAPALALCGGIIVASLAALPAWVWLITALLGVVGLAISLRRGTPDRSRLGVAAALLAAAAVGALLFAWRTERSPTDISQLATPDGRIVTLAGVVVQSPRLSSHPDNPLAPHIAANVDEADASSEAVGEPAASAKQFGNRSYTALTLAVTTVTLADGRTLQADGRVRVTVEQAIQPDYHDRPRTGDRLIITGKLRRFAAPLNPGQADAAELNGQRGLRAELSTNFWAAVRDRQRGPWWSPYVWMGEIRTAILSAIPRGDENGDESAAGPARRIMPALLLGDLSELQDHEQQLFMRSGIVHFLAVSGIHLILFACGLMWLMRRLMIGLRTRSILLILFVTFYCFAIEFHPSVVRAAIYFVLLGLGDLLGRPRSALNTLAGAAFVVLIIAPADIFSFGFQLSFIAVLGLMLTCPRLVLLIFPWRRSDNLVEQEHDHRYLMTVRQRTEDLFCTCITGSLFTMPLMAWHFHLVTPIGFLSNFLAFFLVLPLLILSVVAVIFGLIPGLAAWSGPWDLLNWLSGWLENLSQAAVTVPHGHFYVREFSWLWVAITIGLLLAWTFRARLRLAPWQLPAALVVAVAGYAWLGVPRGPTDEVRITTLAVGCGNTVLVQAPGGYNLLVDCGSDMTAENTGPLVTAPALWKLGVARLDAILLTHADADHVKDAALVAERIPVDRFYLSSHFLDAADLRGFTNSYSHRVVDWIKANCYKLHWLQRGDQLSGPPGLEMQVLNPPADLPTSKENNPTSVVLRLTYAGRTMLLTADASPDRLAAMTASDNLTSDVMLLPHHGQQSPEVLEFLKKTAAPLAVMSVGRYRDSHRRKDFHWPDNVEIFKTYLLGAVTAHLRADGVNVKGFRQKN